MASPLLDSYLQRVGLDAAGTPDLATLRRLHAAHAAAIPFENLDILLGRGIHLDLERLRAKLIGARRGGYCFEQNTLFLAVLREIGFSAVALEARVLVDATVVRPRTHMVLEVTVRGEAWLADVGFGGEGPIEPVPMDNLRTPVAGSCYRVIARGGGHVLQMATVRGWDDQYVFLPQPVHPVDMEVANWYTSTHPQSRFVRTLTAQRATCDVRHVLRYPTYTEIRSGLSTSRTIDRAELLPLLRDVFGIDLPEDTTFPAIDGTARAPG